MASLENDNKVLRSTIKYKINKSQGKVLNVSYTFDEKPLNSIVLFYNISFNKVHQTLGTRYIAPAYREIWDGTKEAIGAVEALSPTKCTFTSA